MRVALDTQLTLGTATGIGEYVRGLAPALRAIGVDVVELRDARLNPWRIDRRVLWDQVMLPLRAGRTRAALLHCASGTMPLRCRLPIVVTVHDVAWARVQRHAPWYARTYFGAFSMRRYRSAAAIVTDSEFSRAELLDVVSGLDPARIRAVSPGVSSAFAHVARHGDRKTILVVGTVEPRKNLAHVIGLLPRLHGARLVSVGPPTPYLAECTTLARRLGVASRVEFRGYVTLDALVELYATAAVAAVPSTYEGFGYAVAQALCAGLPCVSSDRTSLPEVAGDDARVVPLEDTGSWTGALERALSGASDATAAAARPRSVDRFAWRTAAQAIASVYGAVSLQYTGEPGAPGGTLPSSGATMR